MYIQSGAIDHGLNGLFSYSMYRSPYLNEACVSPENGWVLFIGLLADRQFNVGTIFHHAALVQWQNEQQVLQMYSTASRSDSVAMDRCKEARLHFHLQDASD
jgi:hypothetical protein